MTHLTKRNSILVALLLCACTVDSGSDVYTVSVEDAEESQEGPASTLQVEIPPRGSSATSTAGPFVVLPEDEAWKSAANVTPDMKPPQQVSGPEIDPWSHVAGNTHHLSTCFLGLVIDTTGKVEEAFFLAPKEASAMTQSYFLDAVRSWRFEPALQEGAPVRVRSLLSVSHCPYLPKGAAEPINATDAAVPTSDPPV